MKLRLIWPKKKKKKKKYNAHDVYLDDYSNKKVMIFNK